MKKLKTLKIGMIGLMSMAVLAGCEKSNRSFSILADEAKFSENLVFEEIPQKIDVLFVVDNSGSMETSQQALAENFSRFIDRFQALKYDFRIGVTTSDAYLGKFNNAPSFRRLRAGGVNGQSGVHVIDRDTPFIDDVFMKNISQGIEGSGDERAFSSFEDTLDYAGNSDFRRADAYLAIIIVSDEDDYSATTSNYINNNYNDSRIIPVSHYKTFLDGLAGAGNYSVNTISILDGACATQLQNSFPGRHVGQRYIQLADLTGGLKTSLCDNFGDNLQLISDTIINKKPVNSSYKLNREPQETSIVVKVNGLVIAQDPVNGWTYDPANWVVTLHGTAIPEQGGSVSIAYDPKNPKN